MRIIIIKVSCTIYLTVLTRYLTYPLHGPEAREVQHISFFLKEKLDIVLYMCKTTSTCTMYAFDIQAIRRKSIGYLPATGKEMSLQSAAEEKRLGRGNFEASLFLLS
jgi:hypothetical protein